MRKPRQPTTHLCLRHLVKQDTLVLSTQIVLEQFQRFPMPLQGLWAAVVISLILQILMDRLLYRQSGEVGTRWWEARRRVKRQWLSTAGYGGTLGGDAVCSTSTCSHGSVYLVEYLYELLTSSFSLPTLFASFCEPS
jgi:hypothetical protein